MGLAHLLHLGFLPFLVFVMCHMSDHSPGTHFFQQVGKTKPHWMTADTSPRARRDLGSEAELYPIIFAQLKVIILA